LPPPSPPLGTSPTPSSFLPVLVFVFLPGPGVGAGAACLSFLLLGAFVPFGVSLPFLVAFVLLALVAVGLVAFLVPFGPLDGGVGGGAFVPFAFGTTGALVAFLVAFGALYLVVFDAFVPFGAPLPFVGPPVFSGFFVPFPCPWVVVAGAAVAAVAAEDAVLAAAVAVVVAAAQVVRVVVVPATCTVVAVAVAAAVVVAAVAVAAAVVVVAAAVVKQVSPRSSKLVVYSLSVLSLLLQS